MMFHKKIPLAAVFMLLYGSEAWAASSNLLPRPTTESLGMADANVAIAAGPSAQFINPAGLDAPYKQNVWEISAFIANVKAGFERPVARSAAATGGYDANSSSFVPSVAWAHALTPAIVLGFALDVPFGSKIDWPSHTFDRTLPVANGDIAQQAEMDVIRIGPALSYRVSERFSLGARLFGQHVHALEANDLSKIEGNGYGTGFQLGARLQDEGYIIGSSYTSGTHTNIKGELRDVHPAAASVLLVGSVHANIDLPARWQNGLALLINPKLWWETDIDWVNWSSVNDLNITQSNDTLANSGKNLRSYHNVISVYSGLRWQQDPITTWYTGIGYDPTPVDERDASPTINMLRKTRVSVGMQSKFNNGLKFGVAYQYIIGRSRTIHSTAQDNASTSDTQLFEGTYTTQSHIIGFTLHNYFK